MRNDLIKLTDQWKNDPKLRVYKFSILVTRKHYDELKPTLDGYKLGEDYTHGLCSDDTTIAIQTDNVKLALSVCEIVMPF